MKQLDVFTGKTFDGLTVRPSAQFSTCRTWRYMLGRRWAALGEPCTWCMFIGLNPSTADEFQDDPTIRRCIRFARDWGYGGLYMANVFPFRSTDPRALASHAEPEDVRHMNRQAIAARVPQCGRVVAAWGADPSVGNRGDELLALLGVEVYCLGRNGNGSPKHPLYIAADTPPQLYWTPEGGQHAA